MTVAEYNTCARTHSDNVFRFLLKNTKDDAWASDLVQDAFEKLWRARTEIAFEKAKSWLFTTAYRMMIDQMRRKQKQGQWTDEFEEKAGETTQYSGLSEILNEALERLPSVQKQVILLRDYEGCDYKEIGEITSLSESQVKVYIFRARKTLKTYIGSLDQVI